MEALVWVKAANNDRGKGMQMDGTESLIGTIKINNVLVKMHPYSCHSTISPKRMTKKVVRHGNGSPKNEGWQHVMSTSCRYDRKDQDERCTGCTHPYDNDYVESLKHG